MTDNYEWEKSQEQQTLNDTTPFVEKQWNYITDLNNGAYSNSSGTTLVQFNCQNIYNSRKFVSADMFFVLPITLAYQINQLNTSTSAYDINDPTTNSFPYWALLALKNNNANLIHQAEIIVEDKTLEQLMSHINITSHFQMMSRFSQDDLKHYGSSLGFRELDNYKSMKWNGKGTAPGTFSTTKKSGNGMTNNRIFSEDPVGYSSGEQMLINQVANTGVINDTLRRKLDKYSILNGGNYNNFYGDNNADLTYLVNAQQLAKEYQPKVEIVGNVVYYTDYCVIRLKDLYNSIEKMPLLRRWNAKINIYVNTGVCSVDVTKDTGQVNYSYNFDGANTTFNNTCPFTINHMDLMPALAANPGDRFKITAGLFIKQAQPITINGINANWSNGSNLQTCRLYYSQQLLDPRDAEIYVEKNRNKSVVFRTMIFNQDTNIIGGTNFSRLLNAGIKNPIGLLIVPFIAKGLYNNGVNVNSVANNFSQYQSPFDTAPSTTNPISLIDVNASIGGVNVRQAVMSYNYEHFLQEIANVDSLTSTDWGISNGLINQDYWEQAYRCYYLALDRCNPADKKLGRSLSVSFINNSNVAIDVMYFIFYNKEIFVDVQTGLISE